MKYTDFINKNKPQLLLNYSGRTDYIPYVTFKEFTLYVFKGLQVGAWLPLEYTCNIKYGDCEHKNTEYIPYEEDTNVQADIICLDCGKSLPLTNEDDQL